MLQEFDFKVKTRKGTENKVANHLDRLEEEAMEKVEDGLEIDDIFPDNKLLEASQDLIPWSTAYANNIASDLVQEDLSFQQRKKFMHGVGKFFWDDPYFFRIYMNRIIH